jgi:predicted DNA-binding transcriptional regulator AlpA
MLKGDLTVIAPPAESDRSRADDSLLDLDAVCRFFGGTKPLHPCTIYRMMDAGRCPRPVRPSPNANRWLRSECEAALQAIVQAPREPLQSPKSYSRRKECA